MKTTRRLVLALVAILAALPSLSYAQTMGISHAKFNFTAAQVLTFGSGGPEILPPVPGYYYRIEHGTLLKRSGGTFTFAQPGHYVQIQFENTAHSAAINFLVSGVFDQTGEASVTLTNPAIALVTSGSNAVITDIGGKGLRMGVNANLGNYGGTGADCVLDLYYYLLPATAATLDQYPTTQLPTP